MRSSSRLLLLPLLALESLRIGGERDMNGCGEGKAEGRRHNTNQLFIGFRDVKQFNLI